jgi:hypothetical protein
MTMPPPTGNREFRNQVVRIGAELTVNTPNLEDLTFQNCRIIGPAVLVPQSSDFLHCAWDGELDALFWEVPPTRTFIIGGVGVTRCTFSSCTFTMIGLAGTSELRAQMEADLSE